MVPCDVLLDTPNNAGGSWLCSAASQKLNPTKPHTENAIKLSSFASGLPLKHDFGESFEGAVRGWGVVGENWWLAIGVAKVVVENVVRERFCFGEFNGSCDFKVLRWWWRVVRRSEFRGKINGVLFDFVEIRCRNGEEMGEEQEDEEKEIVVHLGCRK